MEAKAYKTIILEELSKFFGADEMEKKLDYVLQIVEKEENPLDKFSETEEFLESCWDLTPGTTTEDRCRNFTRLVCESLRRDTNR